MADTEKKLNEIENENESENSLDQKTEDQKIEIEESQTENTDKNNDEKLATEKDRVSEVKASADSIDGSKKDKQDKKNKNKKPKEKPKSVEKVMINNSLIIAGAVLGVVLIGTLVFSLFMTKSIEGSWCEEKGDIVHYYTFTSDGKFIITSGSISMVNKYVFDVIEDKMITVSNANGAGSFDAYYTVEGNSFSGKTLKLTNEDGDKILEAYSKEIPDIIVKDADFVLNPDAVGTWTNEEGGFELILREDGTAKLDFITQIVEGTYAFEEDKLIVKYYPSFEGEVDKAEYTFKLDGDSLTLETEDSSVTLTRKK